MTESLSTAAAIATAVPSQLATVLLTWLTMRLSVVARVKRMELVQQAMLRLLVQIAEKAGMSTSSLLDALSEPPKSQT